MYCQAAKASHSIQKSADMTMLSLLLVIVSLFFLVVASLSALLAPTAPAVGHLPYGSTCTYTVQSTKGPHCLTLLTGIMLHATVVVPLVQACILVCLPNRWLTEHKGCQCMDISCAGVYWQQHSLRRHMELPKVPAAQCLTIYAFWT